MVLENSSKGKRVRGVFWKPFSSFGQMIERFEIWFREPIGYFDLFELNWKLTIIFDLRLLLISAWISSYFKGVVSLAITGNPNYLKLATDLLQRLTFLKMLFVILFNQILVFRPATILEKVVIYILNLVWRAAISFQTLQTIETSQKITSNASPNKSSLENNYAWYIIADSRIRRKSQ